MATQISQVILCLHHLSTGIAGVSLRDWSAGLVCAMRWLWGLLGKHPTTELHIHSYFYFETRSHDIVQIVLELAL